ncbi:MAG: serine/threonine protein kinase [Xanthobacteraceae bacterium]|nr:serine/threonine protein kinase [Xanthobacteraceae bacterium]QYK44330.1 MAG: serine/threonine protein kinase [Xanthobacteraceae bacterium]
MSIFPHALPIGTRIAGYEIVRVIGRGGFGIVYEAYNPDTEVRVAIKEFLPASIASRHGGTIIVNDERERDTFESVLKSYRKTALLQRKFDHPSILKVIDYIGEDNTGYMITEFIDGHPLAKMWVDKGGHVSSLEELRKTFSPVMDALEYLHGRKHLHRDISPDNIMVDKAGRTVLIDFGALKQDLHASGTFSSAVQLRPDYSPPEQQHPDHDRPMGMYTDIFALAGTMYFALAGRPPGKAMQRLASRGKDPYASIGDTAKIAVSESMAQAIDKGLSLALNDRQASIEEFRANLGWGPAGILPTVAETKEKKGDEEKTGKDEPKTEIDTGNAGKGEAKKDQAPPPPPPPPPPPEPERSSKSPVWPFIALGIAGVIAAGVFLLPRFAAKQELPQTAFCEQAQPYQDALRDGGAALSSYVVRCGNVSQGFGPQAKIALVDRKFAEALQCINAATSCNFDKCLSAYQSAIPDGTGIERVRSEIEQTKRRPQCQAGPKEVPYCEQSTPYNNAISGSESLLTEYVSRCGNSGGYGQQARTVLENQLARVASQCISSASSCSFDHCLSRLQNQFPSSSRLSGLRDEIRNAQNSDRCLEVPNGIYNAIRGYVGTNTDTCRARYDISNVVVQNGSITFVSDDYRWTGTIDQRTGYIDIRDENIVVLRTGQRSRDGISVQGHYRNARLWSGFCTKQGAREGYFRLIK